MRKALICGLLVSLMLLTGSKAQMSDTTISVYVIPTMTEEEADVVAVYTQQWVELHQAFSHLSSLREMLSWQMDRAEADLLKKHDLDPQRWKLDWNTGEFKAREVGI